MQKLKNIVHRTIKTGQKETGNDLSMAKLYKNYKRQVKMNKRLRIIFISITDFVDYRNDI